MKGVDEGTNEEHDKAKPELVLPPPHLAVEYLMLKVAKIKER